jgi:alkylation response protein AidB-like acyl-CoA dehydrogenase
LGKVVDNLSLEKTETSFLAFTADETEFGASAAKFLEMSIPLEERRKRNAADFSASDREYWGEMGWLGLLAPEAVGGSGVTVVEHALFFREVGRRCGPVDILAHVLAVLVTAHNAPLRSSLIKGKVGVVIAIEDGSEFRILGNPDAALALIVEPNFASLWNIHGAAAETRSSLDTGTTMRVIEKPSGDALATVASTQVWRVGELGAAAMLVGLAEVSLEMIVEYAKIRETFGRKIGSYQAVRHPCADMALRAEVARAQLWYAAASLQDNMADAGVHLDAAKHLANQAALANADVNIQLHGGIGVADEHHAHLLLKRALLLSRIFGTKRALLGRLLNAAVQD